MQRLSPLRVFATVGIQELNEMKVKLIAAAGMLGLAAAVSAGSASAQVVRFDPALTQDTMAAEQIQWRGARGGWRGGAYRGGYYRRGPGAGALIGGLAAGALIGGAIASQSQPYYGAPVYGAPVYGAPVYGGNDAVAYCMQRFRSYDPGSGTYLGYDGLRHPCP
jgi:hypothetical protein